jgi:hypothetical protein
MEIHPSISSTSDLTFFFPLRSSGGPAIIDTPLALLLGSCHHQHRQEEEIRHSRVPSVRAGARARVWGACWRPMTRFIRAVRRSQAEQWGGKMKRGQP